MQEHGDAITNGTAPRVNCKRCNGELELKNADGALRFLRGQLAPAQKPAQPMTDVAVSLGGMAVGSGPLSERRTDDVAAPSSAAGAQATPKKKNWGTTVAIGALSLAVVGLVGMQLGNKGQTPAAGTQVVATAEKTEAQTAPKETAAAHPAGTGWMQNVELPPAWVERPFVIEGNDVFVVGKGELSATPEMAIGQARNDAIVRLVKQIHQDIAGGRVPPGPHARAGSGGDRGHREPLHEAVRYDGHPGARRGRAPEARERRGGLRPLQDLEGHVPAGRRLLQGDDHGAGHGGRALLPAARDLAAHRG
jgi:hypothetical protein